MKTRKGGKNAKQNLLNYTKFWQNRHYPEYNPDMDYPGRFKKLFGKTPKLSKSAAINTYTFTRHGYSCANLLKSKKSYQQHTDPDPSLTTYGILSIVKTLPLDPPEGYANMVFVSPLIRTWQTAILEYGMYGPLTLVVSPYIKEKHSKWFGSLDVSNMPLPLETQVEKMRLFFLESLYGINHAYVKRILMNPITLIYDNKEIPLHVKYEPENEFYMNSSLMDTLIAKHMDRARPELDTEVFIPEAKSVPKPSYRDYFGGKGFVYFDHWVKQHFPQEKNIFVVAHSGFMKSILKEYTDFKVETPIFNENVWKLKMVPMKGHFNYKVKIVPGLLKATEELTQMSKDTEPLCHRTRATRKVPHIPYDTSLLTQRNLFLGEPEDRSSAPPRSESIRNGRRYTRNHTDIMSRHLSERYVPETEPEPTPIDVPVLTEIPRISVTESPEVEVEVTATRCYYKVIQYFKDPTNIANLSALLANISRETIVSYIRANASLFQNPYVAFVFIYRPYLDEGIEWLSQSSNQVRASFALKLCFGSSFSPKLVSILLKQARDLIDTDEEVYQLFLSNFSADANRYYYYKYAPVGYVFTLLDFVISQFGSTLTEQNIEPTYRFIIDLVKNGARFSKRTYLVEGVKGDAKNTYQCPVIHDESVTTKVELSPLESTEKSELHKYLSLHLTQVDGEDYDGKDIVLQIGGRILNRVLMGGSRGTSSKKTSPRRFSVRGGRYRALRYKGKRRSRANHS